MECSAKNVTGVKAAFDKLVSEVPIHVKRVRRNIDQSPRS